MALRYQKYSNRLFIGIYVACLLCVIVLLTACRQQPVPRPDGYFRIDAYPDVWRTDTLGGISLQVNDSSRSVVQPDATEGVMWCNVVYPRYNATIYLSYIPVADKGELASLLAESRDLVYRQSVGTAAVTAVEYEDASRPLYAILYRLSAGSATPLQFVATDSLRYLLRGALYYDVMPLRIDSVAPTLEYMEADMARMIESILPVENR